MSAAKLNAEWHQANRMPTNPTLEQRIQWHLEHQKNCACREIPRRIREELAPRGSASGGPAAIESAE